MSVITDMSNEKYHDYPAVNKGLLDAIEKSAAHGLLYMTGPSREETQAMRQGSLIHCATLEPDCLNERYFAFPEKIDQRTKVGKAKLAEFTAQASGRIIVTDEDMNIAKNIMAAVSNNPIARKLLSGGQAEVSVFSTLDDVLVKARPDYLNGKVIIDVKSTDNAGKGFINSILEWRYHVQAAFYSDVCEAEGLDIENFLFLAFEKTPPWNVAIYDLDFDAIEYGRRAYKKNLETFKRCSESGIWPGYEQNIKTLSLPAWVTKDILDY